MKEKRERNSRFLWAILGSCLLVFAGFVLIGQAFTEFGQIFLRNQDEQLYHLAQAVDRNIDSLLDGYGNNLDYVIGRRGFLEAEAEWLETGREENLLFRMEENIVAQDEMIIAILAIRDGEVALSTDDQTEYTIMNESGTEKLRTCKNQTGDIFAAFISEGANGMSYAAVMNLDQFYHHIVGDQLAEYDWVILTDAQREVLLYHQQKNLYVEEVDAVTGASCGADGVDILLSAQEQQVIDTSSYNYMDGESEEEYMARMVVLPTKETVNGAFAIGVVTNFEDFIAPLNTSAFKMICYCCVIISGVLLLLYIVLRFRKRNEKDLKELELLREKNEAMAILNEQTRELAHHQRLEMIGTITSSIAHEFNNLLTPIMGYSVLTLEQLPSDKEEIYDNVLEIYQASLRAREITSQLSRLTYKNKTAVNVPIHLDDLVKNVLHVAVPAMPEGVQVEQDLNSGGVVFFGNDTQISQMILNLVLNGFQAMEEKGGVLKVCTYLKEKEVFLVVSDQGVGIPEERIKNIFEPFFTTKETGKGTGLGLAIVQQVVSDHEGQIELETEEGRGTTFRIKFLKKVNHE